MPVTGTVHILPCSLCANWKHVVGELRIPTRYGDAAEAMALTMPMANDAPLHKYGAMHKIEAAAAALGDVAQPPRLSLFVIDPVPTSASGNPAD